jgi:chemotaxis protein methyltransferase WspC
MTQSDSVICLLRHRIGLDADSVGLPAIDWAVRERMSARGLSRRARYVELLLDDPEEQNALIDRVVVPETWFFRDAAAFGLLEDYARDHWVGRRQAAPARLLSLPCATGEEPYSMAMALLRAGMAPETIEIDAIDISAAALQQAERACYTANSFRGEDLLYRDEFFLALDSRRFAVSDPVRARVRFQQCNLLRPEPWLAAQQYDIIFCRNLLIYLDAEGRAKSIATLQSLLKPSGLIFVGHAELQEMVNRGFRRFGEPRSFACRWPAGSNGTAAATAAQEAPLPGKRAAHLAPSMASGVKPPPEKQGPPPIPDAPDVQQRAVAQSLGSQSALRRIATLADRGAYEKAAALCEDLLRLDPQNAQAYFWQSLICQAQARIEPAEEFLRKALYLNPRHYEALVHLALLLESRGDHPGGKLLRQRAQRARTHAGKQE